MMCEAGVTNAEPSEDNSHGARNEKSKRIKAHRSSSHGISSAWCRYEEFI